MGFCLLIEQTIMPGKQQTETSQSSSSELSTGSSQNHYLNKEVKVWQMLAIFSFFACGQLNMTSGYVGTLRHKIIVAFVT